MDRELLEQYEVAIKRANVELDYQYALATKMRDDLVKEANKRYERIRADAHMEYMLKVAAARKLVN